ncbi:hypothetical protein [Azospirillum endophyticum]
MLTFQMFAAGPGGEMSRRLGLRLDGVSDWTGFAVAASAANRGPGAALVAAARELYCHVSTGERAVLLAALWAADYAWLADELMSGDGRGIWRGLDCADDAHRQAVSAALVRANG